jgi:hypothetical protein
MNLLQMQIQMSLTQNQNQQFPLKRVHKKAISNRQSQSPSPERLINNEERNLSQINHCWIWIKKSKRTLKRYVRRLMSQMSWYIKWIKVLVRMSLLFLNCRRVSLIYLGIFLSGKRGLTLKAIMGTCSYWFKTLESSTSVRIKATRTS